MEGGLIKDIKRESFLAFWQNEAREKICNTEIYGW